jgi:hypothetical protein
VSNPFDWKNSPPKIDWSDLRRNAATSQASTAAVNEKRKRGIEPVSVGVLSDRPAKHDFSPKQFVVKLKK